MASCIADQCLGNELRLGRRGADRFCRSCLLAFLGLRFRVYRAFFEEEMAEQIVWVASAKLGFPNRAVTAIWLGADLINIGREAMLSWVVFRRNSVIPVIVRLVWRLTLRGISMV